MGLLRYSRGPERRIPYGFEFGPGLPFWHAGIIGDAISNQEVKLGILDRPAQVPVRLNFVGGLVIPFGGEFSPRFKSPAIWLADKIHANFRVERGNAVLGKFEMVGPVVETLLGLGIRFMARPCPAATASTTSSRVEAPRPICTMSRVRPFTFMPSMLMSSAVRASGYSGCSA